MLNEEKSSSAGKNNSIIITVVLVLAVGASAFFGGMKYQQSKAPSFTSFNGQGGARMQGGQGRGTQGGGNRANGGFRPILGEIVSSDDKSITVKLQDGSSKIVILSTSTNINKASTAAKTDLTTGQTVSVFGQANQDGSVTAQNIQLNPIIRNNPSVSPAPQQ